MTNGTEGVAVSGADALLVIGLVALVLAFGAFAIVLRRFPARSQTAASTEQLAEQAWKHLQEIEARLAPIEPQFHAAREKQRGK